MAKKADEARQLKIGKLRARNLELERNNANLSLALTGTSNRLEAQEIQGGRLRALEARWRAILRRRNARLAESRHGRLGRAWIHLRVWRRRFRHRGHRAES